MKENNTPAGSEEELGKAIALLSMTLGAWARFLPASVAGFPINDGGLFYVAIAQLVQHGPALPQYIQFNGLEIPFTYPPFGFYVGALLVKLFHLDITSILQWLPAIVTVLTIPIFYWLARPILGSSLTAGIATFIYTCMPIATQWALMGGGLTRSFGLLFLLPALASIYRLFVESGKKYLFLSILFSSLTVLSHPEAAINCAFFILLFWAFYGHNKTGAINAALLLAGTLTLTSLWWIPTLLHFGMAPYVTAAGESTRNLFAVFIPFFSAITGEPQITLIAALGLVGFAYAVSQRNYLLPVFTLMPYLVQPRSGPVYVAIGLAMLASIAITDLILPAISRTSSTRAIPYVVLAYFGLYLAGNIVVFDLQLAGTSVSTANREAFAWVKLNTPPDSRFLILTGEKNGHCDGISEWFPALSERINPATLQGTEWLPGKFSATLETQFELQSCLLSSNTLACTKAVAEQRSIDYDYIYLLKEISVKEACRVTSSITISESVIASFENDSFSSVFTNLEVVIFAHDGQEP